MNVIRFINHSTNASYDPFGFTKPIGMIESPDGYHFSCGSSCLPLILKNEVIEKSTFSSVVSYLCRINGPETYKFVLGKNTDRTNYFWISPEFVLDRNHNLLYLLCCKNVQVEGAYGPRLITENKLIVSPRFVSDTKNIWLNGFKSNVIPFFDNNPNSSWSRIIIEVDPYINKYITRKPVPRNSEYDKEIEKFLKSEEALKYVDSL